MEQYPPHCVALADLQKKVERFLSACGRRYWHQQIDSMPASNPHHGREVLPAEDPVLESAIKWTCERNSKGYPPTIGVASRSKKYEGAESDNG